MPSYRLDRFTIITAKKGARRFTKGRYPEPFGTYSEIRTTDHIFQFNQRGQIKFIRGRSTSWPHPYAYLKRTDGNDWVFYAVGPVNEGHRTIDWLGEYYLPCLPYPSNALCDVNPFADPSVLGALGAWGQLYGEIYGLYNSDLPLAIKDFIAKVITSNDAALHTHANRLRDIIGSPITVLPPDTRHVDYEVIPLILADGCRYHCRFCRVKSTQAFKPRSRKNILRQINGLQTLYGADRANYKALFLGSHDALGAGRELVSSLMAMRNNFWDGNGRGTEPIFFLFGSVDSLLSAPRTLFADLNRLGGHTYINIGFESADSGTLARLGKPLDGRCIRYGFEKMLEINSTYDRVEITGNFLLGDELPQAHYDSLSDVLSSAQGLCVGKGAIYLSPLMDRGPVGRAAMDSQKRRKLMQSFFEVKQVSRLPTYIYLIQRL